MVIRESHPSCPCDLFDILIPALPCTNLTYLPAYLPCMGFLLIYRLSAESIKVPRVCNSTSQSPLDGFHHNRLILDR